MFLIALCFSITIEAIQRFFEPHTIEDPKLVLWVGLAGLLINLIGLFLFHEHSHGHGHGHHDHHGHGHRNTSPEKQKRTPSPETGLTRAESYGDLPEFPMSARIREYKNRLNTPSQMTETTTSQDGQVEPSATNSTYSNDMHITNAVAKNKGSHLNMEGVFLHVLGDALGSVAVVISALVIWLTTWEHRYIIDPILSLIIVVIILASTIPLVRTTCFILLQATPHNIPIDDLKNAILNIPKVVDMHDFHIWQLSDTKFIASVHVLCSKESDFMDIARSIKLKLHTYGVHSTTVQPEFVESRPLHSPQSIHNLSSAPSEHGGEPSSAASDGVVMEMVEMPTSGTAIVQVQSADESSTCLLPCAEPECATNECCPPVSLSPTSVTSPSPSSSSVAKIIRRVTRTNRSSGSR